MECAILKIHKIRAERRLHLVENSHDGRGITKTEYEVFEIMRTKDFFQNANTKYNGSKEVKSQMDSRTSFCKTEVMSMCTATSEADQKNCYYFESSCHSNKCMYFIFNEYCDCLKAQINARKTGVYKL